MKHLWLKYYNVYINHDPVMTLTQFMARSTWVDHVFKLGILLKCHLKGKASRKLASGQNIDYSENKEEYGPRASSAPTLGLNTIIFKHVYWYMQQISGERLQDHWSSCCSCKATSGTDLIQDFWKGGSNPLGEGSFSTFYLIFSSPEPKAHR